MAVPVRGSLDKTTTTYTASGAITARRACKIINSSGAPVVRQCTTAGEEVDGFAMFGVADGDLVTLSMGPFPQAESGGAYNPGDDLMTDTSGRMIAYVAGTGKSVAAKAEEAASGAGVYTIVKIGNVGAGAA